MPYGTDILEGFPQYCLDRQHVWTSRVPLIYFHVVEHYFPDRVAHQFGGCQSIPALCDTDEVLHAIDLWGKVDVDWREKHVDHINAWMSRQDRVLHINQSIGLSTSPDYMDWYIRITRRYVGRLGAILAYNMQRCDLVMKLEGRDPSHYQYRDIAQETKSETERSPFISNSICRCYDLERGVHATRGYPR